MKLRELHERLCAHGFTVQPLEGSDFRCEWVRVLMDDGREVKVDSNYDFECILEQLGKPTMITIPRNRILQLQTTISECKADLDRISHGLEVLLGKVG